MPTAAKTVSDSEREQRREIAKRASAHFPGATVVQPQIDAVIAHVRKTMRSGILKSLACSERQLRSYASGDSTLSDLPDKTRERLSSFTSDAVYSKPWSRKTASMLLEIHASRKRASRKTKRQPAVSEPAAS